MSKKSKKFTTVLLIFACIIAVYGYNVFTGRSKNSISAGTQAKVMGDSDAPLKITEFIDFQCPACAKGSKYLKEQMQKHPQLIQLELKYYPLAMHRHGILSAQYAECAAGQGKFWLFHDLLLDRQNNWKRLTDAQPAFNQMVADVNINVPEFNDCLKGGKMNKAIEKNKLEGNTLGIRSTPTYFVNGKMVVGQKSLELEINKYVEANSY